jgi:hypothetical protein
VCLVGFGSFELSKVQINLQHDTEVIGPLSWVCGCGVTFARYYVWLLGIKDAIDCNAHSDLLYPFSMLIIN